MRKRQARARDLDVCGGTGSQVPSPAWKTRPFPRGTPGRRRSGVGGGMPTTVSGRVMSAGRRCVGGRAEVTAGETACGATGRFRDCRRPGAIPRGGGIGRRCRCANRASCAGCRDRGVRSTPRSTAGRTQPRRSRPTAGVRKAIRGRTTGSVRRRQARRADPESPVHHATAADRQRLLARTGQH